MLQRLNMYTKGLTNLEKGIKLRELSNHLCLFGLMFHPESKVIPDDEKFFIPEFFVDTVRGIDASGGINIVKEHLKTFGSSMKTNMKTTEEKVLALFEKLHVQKEAKHIAILT